MFGFWTKRNVLLCDVRVGQVPLGWLSRKVFSRNIQAFGVREKSLVVTREWGECVWLPFPKFLQGMKEESLRTVVGRDIPGETLDVDSPKPNMAAEAPAFQPHSSFFLLPCWYWPLNHLILLFSATLLQQSLSFHYSQACKHGHCLGQWPPTPVFLPRESHGQRSLASHSP